MAVADRSAVHRGDCPALNLAGRVFFRRWRESEPGALTLSTRSTASGYGGLMLRFAILVSGLFLASVAAACGSGQVHRGQYVRANEELFRQLPAFPGSRVGREVSSPRAGGEDKPTVGYVTRYEIELPAGATAASVSRFYERRLRRGWRLVEKLEGPVLNFRKQQALASINLENAGSGTLEVDVDHTFYP
jgi:hypothetical protein